MENPLTWLRLILVNLSLLSLLGASEFELEVRPFLEKHCLRCHGGEKTKGHIDFSEIKSMSDAESHHELWEAVAAVIEDQEMPPDDEPPLSDDELALLPNWYQKVFLSDIEARPTIFKPRRLSGPEYRNTMRSLFGFDLEVNVIEAEQTVAEKSLVLKLLPTDPPGPGGFINDTSEARLTTTIWDQYSYLTDVALERYFSDTETIDPETVLRDFLPRAFRRPVSDDQLQSILKDLADLSGESLLPALKLEIKNILMSPAFLYRGFSMPVQPGQSRQPVDPFELAERLSYFLWEDMPDAELFELAKSGQLTTPAVYRRQIDRMLASEKSISLAESFGKQWLLLDQITDDRGDPVTIHALQTQPRDFLYYLFTQNRPVMELIDSKTTFANHVTAAFYPGDRKQLKGVVRPRGVERIRAPNQQIELVNNPERGGILTMPGVLAMNKGPILRGTWMLRQILGEHLGEPPADVPPIQSSPKGKNLTFRERFEEHRANESCALCHDKIDPLGFALEAYDTRGKFAPVSKETELLIDTSGQLPGGKDFTNFMELKQILMTSRREQITRNAVERLLSYALCRKLERFDRPTVDALTTQIVETNGTWQDLIHGIANSLPFRETIINSSTTQP